MKQKSYDRTVACGESLPQLKKVTFTYACNGMA